MNDSFQDLIDDAIIAAEKAMVKFPQPNFVMTKFAEEAGEVIRGCIHMAEKRPDADAQPHAVRGEMVQAIAMLYRIWVEGDQVHGLPPVGLACASTAPGARTQGSEEMTLLPPLNTPIQHTGGATCPVHPDTWVSVEYRKVHPRHPNEITGKAGSRNWPDVTTYTIIARAPADRIAELEAALRQIAEQKLTAEMTNGEACDAEFEEGYNAIVEVARAALKGATE